MDKKVILINRPLVRVKGLKVPSRKWQPLDLAYIAAILEKEKNVQGGTEKPITPYLYVR